MRFCNSGCTFEARTRTVRDKPRRTLPTTAKQTFQLFLSFFLRVLCDYGAYPLPLPVTAFLLPSQLGTYLACIQVTPSGPWKKASHWITVSPFSSYFVCFRVPPRLALVPTLTPMTSPSALSLVLFATSSRSSSGSTP